MPFKIKPGYGDHVIGYNNSSAPLGKRSDLGKLYEMAKATDNKEWLDMFDGVPDEADIDKEKTEKFQSKQDDKKKLGE